ncbi:MAG TPA: hypothetical protein VFK78_08890 [Gemmatimonadales bacterium]|nr:hypothetical protein [Gemmatimonadales bacterium]
MTRALLAAVLVVAGPLAAQDSTAKRTVQLTGVVLINAFYNSAAVNNSDVPQIAAADTIGVRGAGGSIRQTRLGVLVDDPNVLGGTFSGEVDADFFGGQLAEGRTFPLLHLRRATATLSWTHASLMIGQETPLISDRNPRSLAQVGIPGFSGSGNLWLWIPQIRATAEWGYTLRLAIQGAVLAPTGGTPQSTFSTQPDSAERTSRPYLEGRVRLAWGPTDDPSEIAIGGHQGWLRGLDSTSGDTILNSQALTADTRLKFGPVEILGEGFVGKALAGLGGGGVGQNFGAQGAPVRTKGGWGQLNFRATRAWLLGGGCGLDNPTDADVPAGGKLENFVCEGHLRWDGEGGLVAGFEFWHFRTTYSTGDFTANHLNFAAGYRF